MFGFFLLPASMAIGGALVSVPIVIHLINRMRFRRIRWAAMEFLLKSQKRNRRRLILEQLLLLLLRCALVVLAAFLVARFVGCSAAGGSLGAQTSFHFVVLDDSLSMTDQWKDQGAVKNSFDEGKQLIQQIAKNASLAGAAQQFRVVVLSNPERTVFDDRLNNDTLLKLNETLADLKCGSLHLKPQEGVQAALEYFGENPLGQRVLHFVSDLRSRDWSGTEADALNADLDTLCKNGVHVNLVDSADPGRVANQPPLHHDNLGIVELRPETRVAAEGQLVQFYVTIRNFSSSDRDNVFLTVKVDGTERLEASQPIQKIAAKSETTHAFSLAFVKPGFNQVSATLAREETGVEGDDRRFTVVEVRKQVPILIIDGEGAAGLKPGGDTFYLQTVFTAARGFQVVPRGPEELNKPGLDQYPSIFLLNLPELRNPAAIRNLEDYVRQGGNVAFFAGSKVRADYYNRELYKEGKGLFPVPLEVRPTDPLTPEEREERLLLDDGLKIFIRNKTHPVFTEVAPFEGVFRFLVIDRYWPAQPRFKWNADPGTLDELVTLPNRRSIDDYKVRAQELLREIPVREEKYEKYRAALERHQKFIRDSLSGKLYELASAYQAMLEDTGDPSGKDPARPNLKEFWDLPELQRLRSDLDRFRETVQYGDPLVVSKRFGKGRVLAFLTTAGKAWNDWPGGCPASPTYPVVMLELQKHLASGGDELSRFAGAPLRVELDATRYENKMHRYFQPELAEVQPNLEGAPGPKGLRNLGEQLADADSPSGRVLFTFDEAKTPGVYQLEFFPRPEPGQPEPRPEQRAYVFNVDTLTEGDLQRATRDDLERNPSVVPHGRGKITLWTTRSDMTVLTQAMPDWSQHWSVFLIILAVLVCEQALAVHLSFHLKGNEAQLPAAVRPQAAPA